MGNLKYFLGGTSFSYSCSRSPVPDVSNDRPVCLWHEPEAGGSNQLRDTLYNRNSRLHQLVLHFHFQLRMNPRFPELPEIDSCF